MIKRGSRSKDDCAEQLILCDCASALSPAPGVRVRQWASSAKHNFKTVNLLDPYKIDGRKVSVGIDRISLILLIIIAPYTVQ